MGKAISKPVSFSPFLQDFCSYQEWNGFIHFKECYVTTRHSIMPLWAKRDFDIPFSLN